MQRDFPGGSDGKASVYNAGDLGSIPGLGRYLEKEMATHSNTIAWKIPWTEEPGRLQSMGSQRVGHDWATLLSLFTIQRVRHDWATELNWTDGNYDYNDFTNEKMEEFRFFLKIVLYSLYIVVLVSAIQLCEWAICIHMSPPSWAALPCPPLIPPL